MSRSAKKAQKKGLTKSQLVSEVAKRSGLTKSQVNAVFDGLQAVVGEEIKNGRPVAIPGLAKISVQRKAATQARQGMAFGQPVTIKARPARSVVKVRALKALKEAV